MVDSKFSALPAQISSDSDDSDYSPPNSRKGSAPRPKSSSFIALKDAVYQLTCLNDFTREKIGQGFFAEVFKVSGRNVLQALGHFILLFRTFVYYFTCTLSLI